MESLRRKTVTSGLGTCTFLLGFGEGQRVRQCRIFVVMIDFHTHHPNVTHRRIANIRWGISDVNIAPPVSIGIHPMDVTDDWQEALDSMKDVVRDASVVAVGECGLDALCSVPLDLQRAAFLGQVDLSSVIQKPLVIHCVRVHDEVIHIRKTHQSSQVWFLHGFSRSAAVAKRCLDAGLYLSFGATILGNPAAQESLRITPLDMLLLETDDADVRIENIYSKAAELKGIGSDSLKAAMATNARSLFGDNFAYGKS